MNNPVYLFTRLVEGDAKTSSAELLSLALSAYFEESAQRPEELVRTPEGKPFAPSGRFHLSVTHTGALFAAAFAPFPIGIDGERKEEARERIALRCFTPEERALPFSHVWCAKEAVAKLTGRGLSLLSRIRVERERAFLDEKTYRLTELSCSDYILTLAWEEGENTSGIQALSEK